MWNPVKSVLGTVQVGWVGVGRAKPLQKTVIECNLWKRGNGGHVGSDHHMLMGASFFPYNLTC